MVEEARRHGSRSICARPSSICRGEQDKLRGVGSLTAAGQGLVEQPDAWVEETRDDIRTVVNVVADVGLHKAELGTHPNALVRAVAPL